jgi:nitroimidazol reductase NimA-like FMN-containing flavoprotein (pyridoxamine 5'-phosphate oxidase superfamily)
MTVDGEVFTGSEAAFVEVQRVAYLATVFADGRPHVVPISAVLDLNRLVFASERSTQKIRNLAGDPHCSIGCDEYHEDWDQLKQVVMHGQAYFVDSGPEFERDRGLLYAKFPQYEAKAPIEPETSVIVEIRVDLVASWGL